MRHDVIEKIARQLLARAVQPLDTASAPTLEPFADGLLMSHLQGLLCMSC